ncbi:MAG: ubiquinol-cytochrome c reductase iron-sulfur subunit, partial [Pseudomonadota bacterium]
MTGKPDESAALSARASVEVDVADLKPGEIRKASWRGREVWILRRSAQDIARLGELGPYLQDPDSQASVQPVLARNPHRSLQPDLFVFYPTENLRTCQVTWHGPQDPHGSAEPWYGGFAEQCFG